ncbi:unnamed protein product [Merluccius merluccius]
MDTKDQITRCAAQIETLNRERSYGDVRALLRDLDGSPVTVGLLQATDTVETLYRVLKTCSDAHVKKAIKGVLSKWRKRCSQSDVDATLPHTDCAAAPSLLGGAPAGSEVDSPVRDSQHTRPLGGDQLSPTAGSSRRGPSEKTHPASTPEDPSKPSGDFPGVRSKCLQLLLAALSSQGPPGKSKEEQDWRLASDVEHHIHALHAASELKYKACVRSKVANLRNPKSGHLRRGLLDRSLPPRDFARMTAEEMAGPDLRRLRREYATRAVSEHQLPRAPEGTPTRKLRCRRCGASDCTVSQVSRGVLFLPGWVKPGGPDHDGVTFVTCSVCGEQWYHSGWVCL